MKHIFLTGVSGIGKTTIIESVISGLELLLGGFRTIGEKVPNGTPSYVYLYPIKAGKQGEALSYKGNGSAERFVVASRDGVGSYHAFPEIFDEAGTAALEDLEGAELILMDELGFMENEAYRFQDKVMNVLDGHLPILGVIKQKDTPFLERVRSHPNVAVIEITESNRDEVAAILRKKFLNRLEK